MQQLASSVSVDLDVPVEVRDGTILRANVYRPTGGGRWPVLLTRLPYGKDLPLGSLAIDPVQAARRGFAVVVQDTRGRFTSGGDWYPVVNEAEDGFDTVAWAAAQPFSDGEVGMYGASYFGYTQWSAATQQPPALKAMVPYMTWSEPFNGLVYRGGAFELGVQAAWHLTMGLDVLVRRHRTDGAALRSALTGLFHEYDALGPQGYAELPLREFGPHRRQPFAPAFFRSVSSPMDASDPFAHAASIADRHDQVTVPTLNVGGWYDIFLADTIANYRAMRALGRPAQLLIGPWAHTTGGNPVGERTFGFGAQTAFVNLEMDMGSLQLRWFDHWLRGRDTGMLRQPPVRIFVMGTNRWRYEEDFPLERAEIVPHYLHQGGRLDRTPPGEEPPDRYAYDPARPVPTCGGALLMTPDFPAGPRNQQAIEARPDVLTFSSEPLGEDVEVTGPIVVRLWAVSSASDTDFVARLCDVFPDGRSFNLTDGILRARYRSWRHGEPVSLIEPGRPYEYEIDLWATSNVFRAGHRIRLQVTSSSFPRWDRNPNTGHEFGADTELVVARQEILHDREHPSCVLLPVVPR